MSAPLRQYLAGVAWLLLCSPLTVGLAASLALWVLIACAVRAVL